MSDVQQAVKDKEKISFEEFRTEVLNDYRLAVSSREASLIGRKEVLTGKAELVNTSGHFVHLLIDIVI